MLWADHIESAVQLISDFNFNSPSAREAYRIMTDPHRDFYDRRRELEWRTYFSCELNLVLRTGDRITVMDHSDGDEVGEATERIANFFGRANLERD